MGHSQCIALKTKSLGVLALTAQLQHLAVELRGKGMFVMFLVMK